MKVKCIDNSYYLISLTIGKIYEVIGIEGDELYYRIVDDTDEDYLFEKDIFVLIEGQE